MALTHQQDAPTTSTKYGIQFMSKDDAKQKKIKFNCLNWRRYSCLKYGQNIVLVDTSAASFSILRYEFYTEHTLCRHVLLL